MISNMTYGVSSALYTVQRKEAVQQQQNQYRSATDLLVLVVPGAAGAHPKP